MQIRIIIYLLYIINNFYLKSFINLKKSFKTIRQKFHIIKTIFLKKISSYPKGSKLKKSITKDSQYCFRNHFKYNFAFPFSDSSTKAWPPTSCRPCRRSWRIQNTWIWVWFQSSGRTGQIQWHTLDLKNTSIQSINQL